MKKRLQVGVVLVALLSCSSVLGSTALADEPSEVNEEISAEILSETETVPDVLPEMETPSEALSDTETSPGILLVSDPQLVGEVRIIADDGDADLNTICACIMVGFGSVCGILAGSELVKKWKL